MSKLENDTPVEIDDAALDEVSGGPIYMSPVSVQLTTSQPSTSPVAHVALGDGSVRVGG